jgi:6-phosphogluconolactonase
MKNKDQNIFKTSAQDFNQFAANFIKEKLEKITHKNVINIALSGGSTPIPILNILKGFKLNWDKFNFFLVDERFVNINSDDSNYKNINASFFKDISSVNFSILQENLSLDQTVIYYRKKIENNLKFLKPNIPKFDLIILGMGTDGHTASLFPNSEALVEQDNFVVKNYVSQLDSFRITLSYPTLLNGEERIILIKGKEKESVFKEIISGQGLQYPITKLLSSNSNWIIGT